jgi:hypothetical protein
MDTKITSAMQAVVQAYFKNSEAKEGLEDALICTPNNPMLYRLTGRMEGFEAECLVEMRSYAREFPASRWAMTVIPDAYAAGYACGIHVDFDRPIVSPGLLAVFCGMEAKRYLPAPEVKRILIEITKGRTMGLVTKSEVRQLADIVERNPFQLGENPTFEEVYMWATKRRHSEFLRWLSISLGHWMSTHENPYLQTYIENLAINSSKPKVPSMEQIEQRSRNAAVRKFLLDYHRHMVGGELEEVRRAG